jgi:hypothetical protein
MAGHTGTVAASGKPAVRTLISAWCGLASAACGLLGAVFVSIGVSALPGPWIHGYVSEGGVATAAHSTIYRLGIATLALSIGLLGIALAQKSPNAAGPRWLPAWWPAAWLSLIIAAALGLTSSRVSCTQGCPLPPYQRTSFQDLVHAVASVGAVGFTALAMLSIALIYPAGPLRRAARIATVVCMPMLTALAIAILAVGRGTLTGVLERASLVAVLAAVVGCALIVAADMRRVAGGAL